MATVTFEQWFQKANAACEATVGLSLDDLPDVCYMDMFETGVSPREAVSEALAYAGYDGEESEWD